MVTLILGRAGAGKTRRVMDDFAGRINNGDENLYYIVPEQYSHDAERQLLKYGSDALSLQGEVLSFSRLCSRVFAENGNPALTMLDKGGKVLFMSRAVDAVSDKLCLYGGLERKEDFLEMLIQTAGEFKSAGIAPDELDRLAQTAAAPLNGKLRDLSLILSSYDSLLNGDIGDPDDKLSHLADVLTKSALFRSGHVYFDGFSDFTAQELRIVKKLIQMGTDMTVCLTCDGLFGAEPLFELARKTAHTLLRAAADCGEQSNVVELTADPAGRNAALTYIEQNLFSGISIPYDGPSEAVELYRATTPSIECEYAAARVLELVRSGYRWRDIAVAVCDFSSYGRLAEDIFTKYGIPVFVGHKADITQKPPLAVLDSALAIITGGWDCDSVFRYLKTGMAGLSTVDCDELENYALLWDIKGSAWTRGEDWTQPTSGYEPVNDHAEQERLERINTLRRLAVGPVLHLKDALAVSRTYGGKLRALYLFLEEIGLPERMADKEAALREDGELQLADEYRQLWDIIVRALDQFYEVLGVVTGSNMEFARLWKLLTSQYEIASIPVALDRVSLGDLPRQRRRGLKCLLVLGATDDVLPKTGAGGLLSDDERRVILSSGIQLPGGAEERLYREMNTIYSTLMLPSDKLIVSYHTGGSGGEKRASFVVKRLSELLGLFERTDETPEFRTNAAGPCFELAASYVTHGGGNAAAAAASYFMEEPEMARRLRTIAAAASQSRGKLSYEKAAELYGSELSMSASRVDKFYACRFQYFLQYGLNARPRKPAGFDAPTAGTFMHYVLENVTREITERGGFTDIDDEACSILTEKYADEYARDVLQSFKDKSSRFVYLFNRLKKDAAYIVLDMVGELRQSDFVPLDFELSFTEGGDIPPCQIESGDAHLKIKGFVDRLDGWERDGQLYIRVVDYKTGKKKFSLSDVCYGLNMQMLIYLFALEKNGGVRYGKKIVPAGVLYAPAREDILPASRSLSDAELEAQRAKKLRRSGLVLGEPGVINAMEHGDDKKYLPVKTSAGGLKAGDALAETEQFEDLSRHIDRMLSKIAGSVHGGSIEARPYYKGQADTACLFCDYRSACHFSEKDGDKRQYLKKLTAEEAWQQIKEDSDT